MVGAIAMGAIVAGLWTAGCSPHETAAPPDARRPQGRFHDEISSRLDKIQAAPQAPQPDPALAARVAAAEAKTKSLGDSLAALNRRLDEVAATSQSALAQAKAAAAAADGDEERRPVGRRALRPRRADESHRRARKHGEIAL